EGLSRLVDGRDTRRDAVRGRAGVRGRTRQGGRLRRSRSARGRSVRRAAEAAALPRSRRSTLGLPRQRARPDRGRDRRPGHLRWLRLRGRALDRVRLSAARCADRYPRRDRRLRRVGWLRGQARAPVRPDERPDSRLMEDIRAEGAAWSATRRRGSPAELAEWLAFALALCDQTDPIALHAFRTELAVDRKADGSFVTDADREVETIIRGRIADRYPEHGLVGEEYGEAEAGAGGERWYIDPIDGTHNFLRGVPLFATLLAVERDWEVQAGVMSAPALRQRWYAP